VFGNHCFPHRLCPKKLRVWRACMQTAISNIDFESDYKGILTTKIDLLQKCASSAASGIQLLFVQNNVSNIKILKY
jgi:hypothetical protein